MPDDSCPSCGESNGTGLACHPCFVRCDEHEEYAHHPEADCPLCEVDALLSEVDPLVLEYIENAIKAIMAEKGHDWNDT